LYDGSRSLSQIFRGFLEKSNSNFVPFCGSVQDQWTECRNIFIAESTAMP
jgi:hypothetical protein